MGGVRGLARTPDSAVVPVDDDTRKFSPESVVKQISHGVLLGVQTRPAKRDARTRNVREFDSLQGEAEREIVKQSLRNYRDHVRLPDRAGTEEAVEHRGKAVWLICP